MHYDKNLAIGSTCGREAVDGGVVVSSVVARGVAGGTTVVSPVISSTYSICWNMLPSLVPTSIHPYIICQMHSEASTWKHSPPHGNLRAHSVGTRRCTVSTVA